MPRRNAHAVGESSRVIDDQGLLPEDHLSPHAPDDHVLKDGRRLLLRDGAGAPARVADGGRIEKSVRAHFADKSEFAVCDALRGGKAGPGDRFPVPGFQRFGKKPVDGGKQARLPGNLVRREFTRGHVFENGNHFAGGKFEYVIVRPEGLFVVLIKKGGMFLRLSRPPDVLKSGQERMIYQTRIDVPDAFAFDVPIHLCDPAGSGIELQNFKILSPVDGLINGYGAFQLVEKFAETRPAGRNFPFRLQALQCGLGDGAFADIQYEHDHT